MNSMLFVVPAMLAILVPVNLAAKGATIGIRITGPDLSAPIEITDPDIVGKFQVWAGPGTSSSESASLNADWTQPVAAPPAGIRTYTVSFVTDRAERGTYIVRYAVDPASGQAYVYLPAKSEPEYRDNVWMILRRVEGQWFRAWSEFEKIANPLIANARANR
jgi:hypothetical protein